MGEVVGAVRPSGARIKEPLLRHVVGDILREARHERGRRLADVALDAGISPQYLSEIERGRKEPSSEVLAAVLGALGLTLGELAVLIGHDLRSWTELVTAVVVPLSSATGGPAEGVALAVRAAGPVLLAA